MEFSDTYYWYWFVNISGTGVLTQKKLYENYGHPSILYSIPAKDLTDVLEPHQRNSYDASKNEELLRQSYQNMLDSGARFVHWEDPEYPEPLRHLYDAPYAIYVRGSLPDLSKPRLAIVGSRAATNYGISIAREYSSYLAKRDVSIISGLAAGIDAAAHQGALSAGGYTMGFLGGGIDTIYPRYNFNLYQRMYECGGVVSEHNIGVPNASGLFPIRNRLISAMSDGILVVEAREKSGSLITADQGLEQGKEIFALPGRVTDPLSRGCNNLIAQGARIVQSPDDILEYLQELYGSRQKAGDADAESTEAYDKASHMIFQTLEEKNVYELLDEIHPKTFDELAAQLKYPYPILMHTLFSLELKQYILQSDQNAYIRALNL